MTNFNASTIEKAFIEWLKNLSYLYTLGSEIGFDGSVRTLASRMELQSEKQEELDALLPSVLDRAFRGEL